MAIEPVSDASGGVTTPPVQLTHDPCCSAHGARLDCETYRRSHFVEVGPCCSTWAKEHPEYGTASEPKRPEASAPAGLPDIEKSLRQLFTYRERNDNLTRAQVLLADRLTSYVTKLIPTEERETAGKVMVHAASALAALLEFDINPAALCNVQMLAGERMVAEARGRNGVPRG